MFRFLGLAWNHTAAGSRAAAEDLVRSMRAVRGWEVAIGVPGLYVFVTGTTQDVNEVLGLRDTRGVILGKVFSRDEAARPSAPRGDLDLPEQERILRSRGVHLVDAYWGRYVAFLRHAEADSDVLRDPSGALPCFRMFHEGVSVAFSWLEDVLALLPRIPAPRVDWEALAAHIAFATLSGRATALEGVEQVLPGERVSLTNKAEPPALLWDAGAFASRPCQKASQDAAVDLRETVQRSVLAWAACYDHILLRLSGGLDSSIVVSCLEGAPGDVTCLNYYSPGSNSDERSYARAAALRARRPLIERERDSRIRLEKILDVSRTPLPSGYAGRLGSSHIDAALAHQLEARAMFTGAGGDQLFFQFRQWWGAADYLQLRGIDTGLWSAAIDSAMLSDLSVWEVLRLAWHERRRRNEPSLPSVAPHLALAVLDALPARPSAPHQHPALGNAASLPIGKRNHLEYLLTPVDYYDPYETAAAPEIVNPLLSQPVIERCLSIPTYVLAHGGRPRALARQAFRDAIPLQIVDRHSKGGMEEHSAGILWQNLAFAQSLLLDGELVARGFLDRSKVELALSDRPSTLAAYTGELHIYLGIEAWLQRMRAPF